MSRVNWQGKEVEALELRFKTIHEDWNEYDLDDGSTLRLKTIVSEIVRLQGEYDPENNPMYLVKSAGIIIVKAPDNLKKKG